MDVSLEPYFISTGRCDQPPVGGAQGRSVLAVAHPWREVGMHPNCAGQAVHDPHHHRHRRVRDHQIGDADRAARRGPPCFQNERARTIPTSHRARPTGGDEAPSTVPGVAEKGRADSR